MILSDRCKAGKKIRDSRVAAELNERDALEENHLQDYEITLSHGVVLMVIALPQYIHVAIGSLGLYRSALNILH